MKIISVHNRYQQAGGEDGSTAQERALLNAHGHEVLEYEEHNDRIEKMSKLHVALRTIWSLETYRKIRRLIAQEHPDLVHVQNFFPLISPSIFWACHKEGIPVVMHVRNFRLLCPSAYLYFQGHIYEDNVGKLFPWRAVKDAVYRDSRLATLTVAVMLLIHRMLGTWTNKVTAYIALTEFQKNKLIEGGLAADKIFVKPNFLKSVGCSKDTKNDFPATELGKFLGERSPYFLFVGRMSPEKGCDVLIRAWPQFLKRLTADQMPQLLIVGDGPDEAGLMDLARGLDSVSFLGRKGAEDVLAMAQGALALVFPSVWYEGMPRTIIEAFSVSTPVIASGIGSMGEMIEHKKTGLLFESGNSEELAFWLEWAFVQPEKMLEMGCCARQEFEEKYTSTVNYKMLMGIYEKASRNL